MKTFSAGQTSMDRREFCRSAARIGAFAFIAGTAWTAWTGRQMASPACGKISVPATDCQKCRTRTGCPYVRSEFRNSRPPQSQSGSES